jgi:poly(3-hydroxybutyrate) depolymerase
MLTGALLSTALVPVSASDGVKLNLNLEQTSVSGLSSGGYMATQFQLAHSQTIVGAGIVGAGPYYCALNDIGIALGQCVSKASSSITNEPFIAQYERFQADELLASKANIEDDRVLIIHGTLDETVNRTAANLLAKQYQQWLGDDQLTYIDDKAFSHHFPTLGSGTACDVSQSPFIGNCGFDAAGEILKHIYGELTPPKDQAMAEIATIDLSQYASLSGTSIADEAYIYVPAACADGELCTLHISFHGCNQSSEDVDNAYAQQSGFNRWADANDMVVLYPQVKKSMFMPLNPQGCWDWWGYTDENYANKQGPQIKAIYNVMQALGAQ